MSNLLYKEEVYAAVGAAMEVYNTLGSGFLEPVYQEALEIELIDRHISFTAQQELPIFYKGRRLKRIYLADLVVLGKVIVELKALDRLTSREESQLLNYLKATGLEVGVLLNFGSHRKLEWNRMVRTMKLSANNPADTAGTWGANER